MSNLSFSEIIKLSILIRWLNRVEDSLIEKIPPTKYQEYCDHKESIVALLNEVKNENR